MGRQFRSVRSGEVEKSQSVLRASSTAIGVPNYGVTELTTVGAVTDWVLDAPVEGCRKTVFCTSATTGLVMHLSTGGTVSVGNSSYATIQFDGAGAKVVEMVGLNSTKWLITSIVPVSTALIVSS